MGELRTVSSPAYTAKDRDKALVEQSACRERINGLQSKITAFSQRMNLINQRGTPDEEELRREAEHVVIFFLSNFLLISFSLVLFYIFYYSSLLFICTCLKIIIL